MTFQNFNCVYNSIPTCKKPFQDANYGWPTSTSLDDLYDTITTVAGFRISLGEPLRDASTLDNFSTPGS